MFLPARAIGNAGVGQYHTVRGLALGGAHYHAAHASERLTGQRIESCTLAHGQDEGKTALFRKDFNTLASNSSKDRFPSP